jgi:hypothetical protein
VAKREGVDSNKNKKRSSFYQFRLKWMPFANLAIIVVAIVLLLKLPHVKLTIIEPSDISSSSHSSSVLKVTNPFNLRLGIQKTLGCEFNPQTLKAEAKSASGSTIPIDDVEQDKNEWIARDINLPLGEYQLSASLNVDCGRPKTVSDSVRINVVCIPLTAEKARANGDVCGNYVLDGCGAYVKLDSCQHYGSNDQRIINKKLNCKQTGYYVGKSISQYIKGNKTEYYYTALKCGSGNNKDCYKLPSSPGSCRYSSSPEELGFYGNKDDTSFHKCRIECI